MKKNILYTLALVASISLFTQSCGNKEKETPLKQTVEEQHNHHDHDHDHDHHHDHTH